MRTCLLCSNILPRYPHFLPSFISPCFMSSLSCVCLAAPGGIVRRGHGRKSGPKGPQQAPIHTAGTEGRPPREE